MIYQNFSKRQLLTLTWWNKPQFMDCDGIICDGSIRSGKTVSMTDGFILWSMSRFNGQNFAICGKTIESLRRNVITLMPQWLEGIFSITERRSENKLIITSGGVTNSYYMFGGKDESSYTLVQGITLAGVLFDRREEVRHHPADHRLPGKDPDLHGDRGVRLRRHQEAHQAPGRGAAHPVKSVFPSLQRRKNSVY